MGGGESVRRQRWRWQGRAELRGSAAHRFGDVVDNNSCLRATVVHWCKAAVPLCSIATKSARNGGGAGGERARHKQEGGTPRRAAASTSRDVRLALCGTVGDPSSVQQRDAPTSQHARDAPCPAVSQISNFTVLVSKCTVCVRNAAPIVGSWNSKNSSRTKRTTRHDLPTAVSPSSTSLKWHVVIATGAQRALERLARHSPAPEGRGAPHQAKQNNKQNN